MLSSSVNEVAKEQRAHGPLEAPPVGRQSAATSLKMTVLGGAKFDLGEEHTSSWWRKQQVLRFAQDDNFISITNPFKRPANTRLLHVGNLPVDERHFDVFVDVDLLGA